MFSIQNVFSIGKPALRSGLASTRFGLITVAVIAAVAALLTWLPFDAYNQPITHPVKAIADSVTRESPKGEESKAVSVVRKGLETVGWGILAPSDQPASPSSVAPIPQAPAPAPQAPASSDPAPALTPTSDWGSSSEAPASDSEPPIYEVPAVEPEPIGAPAGEPVPEAPAVEPEPVPEAPVVRPEPAPEAPVVGPAPAPEAPTGEPTPIGPPVGEPEPAPEAPVGEPAPAPPNFDD